MKATRWKAGGPLALGFGSIILLLTGLGAWGLGTRISGAVVANGTIEVDSDRQVVQHSEGGVVDQILARDGDQVVAGDVLVRFDGTFLRSELAMVERQLLEIASRRARLTAERDGTPGFALGALPVHLTIDETEIARHVAGQERLFDARRHSLETKLDQLGEQQAQIDQQIAGTEAQLRALGAQLNIVSSERTDLEALLAKGLVQSNRVLELLRDEAGMQGEIGRLTAAVAEARARRSALAIEKLRLSDRRREEAISRLRDLAYAEIELMERWRRLLERLSRLEVAAPIGGVVFGSTLLGVGAVVRPAEPMMHIVPGGQPHRISAKIDTIDIDQVFPGQPVTLAFTAFSRRTTPHISGWVARVSADAARDEQTGAAFYEAVITPDAAGLAATADLALVPGMPVEVFLRTEERTPFQYLVQPLSNYFTRAFREQ